MHPQQLAKLGKYHHERCTEEVCGEGEEESKDEEGKRCGGERETVGMRVGLRWRMFWWCCMCMYGVGEEDGGGDEGGGEGEGE